MKDGKTEKEQNNEQPKNEILEHIYQIDAAKKLFESIPENDRQEVMEFILGYCHELNKDLQKFKSQLTPESAEAIMRDIVKNGK